MRRLVCIFPGFAMTGIVKGATLPSIFSFNAILMLFDKRYILKLSFAWKTLLNMSQCTTKPTNDVCHVETLIRLKCEKYSVINVTCTN